MCTLKTLFLTTCLGAASVVNGQTLHPLTFTKTVGTTTYKNWYKDYVGLRFAVTSPVSVSGEKIYTTANDGGGATSQWGGVVTAPIINKPIVMPQAGDSLATVSITVSMTGKIALVYRGSNQFVCKATAAQAAGAIACVIVNNIPGGPVGMGAGSDCSAAGVTIPVFMISKADGDALDALYCSGIVPTMTITPWGLGLQRDLGYVPQGISRWHNYATPARDLISSGNPVPYAGLDGAFVANYGSSRATNVVLSSSVMYTPTGGSATSIHTGSVALSGAFDNSTGSLPTASRNDSIWAMYMPQYDLTGITGTGSVNVKYTISSDSTDQFPADDTLSYNFYLSDSLYSKGRYDFAAKKPMANLYTSASLTAGSGDNFYIWGNAYYVNKAGAAARSTQWTMSHNTDTGDHITTITTMNVYLFKWVDGGVRADSFIQNGELQLVGLGIKDFATAPLPGDTSGGTFTVQFGDSSGTIGADPVLSASSWYYVAPEVPNGWFLGCDGTLNCFPRTFGRANFNNYLEYYSPEWSSDRYSGTTAMVNTGSQGYAAAPFGLSASIDSVIFDTQKGLIPAVTLLSTTHPHVQTSVDNVKSAFAKFELFPNPATDHVNVSLGLDQTARTVTYTIVDGAARVISKVTHNDVKSETYEFSTQTLPAGHYYMTVVADGKAMFKKFAVVR